MKHINSVCKACYMNIRNIRQIRKYLTQESDLSLVHAFITCKLDSLNVLLIGIPDYLIRKLQLVQNTAARIATNTPRYEHISEVLRRLYWLPIPARIEYKVVLLTYKALNGLAPSYVSNMLHYKSAARSLRSSQEQLPAVPKSRLSSLEDRSFSYFAPKCWNTLPHDLRTSHSVETFESLLKNHIFNKYYCLW